MPAGALQATVVTTVALVHAAGLWALLGHTLQPQAAVSTAPPQVAMVMLLNEPAAPVPARPLQAQPAAAPEPPPALPRRPARPPRVPVPAPAPAATPAAEPAPVELPPPSSDVAITPATPSTTSAAAAPAAPGEGAAPSAPAPALQVAAASGVTRRIEAADYLRAPVLEYPSASRRFREQGRVVLRVLIGRDGQAEKIELVEASAFPRLNDAAVEAARRALYKPHTEDGVAQPAWALVALSFQLRH